MENLIHFAVKFMDIKHNVNKDCQLSHILASLGWRVRVKVGDRGGGGGGDKAAQDHETVLHTPCIRYLCHIELYEILKTDFSI